MFCVCLHHGWCWSKIVRKMVVQCVAHLTYAVCSTPPHTLMIGVDFQHTLCSTRLIEESRLEYLSTYGSGESSLLKKIDMFFKTQVQPIPTYQYAKLSQTLNKMYGFVMYIRSTENPLVRCLRSKFHVAHIQVY
ncbi:hypothetical protein Hdeb2414_s0014g00423681 [Helianthus debilis subsp. tardiflorus]